MTPLCHYGPRTIIPTAHALMRVLPLTASFPDQRPLLRDGPCELFPANPTVGPSPRVPVLLPPLHPYRSTRRFSSLSRFPCSTFCETARIRKPSTIPDVRREGHDGYAEIRSRSLSTDWRVPRIVHTYTQARQSLTIHPQIIPNTFDSLRPPCAAPRPQAALGMRILVPVQPAPAIMPTVCSQRFRTRATP
ncbi:hypothetical protein FKP32DRAFT_790995 [Trametes sanguinea]|nr:hypothetical protein FKP32DRAFT_790995 [Trametes sanguinea]